MEHRTKVDERREADAYDRQHPWQPLTTAVINDGTVCELLFSDMLSDRKARYFLGEDDHWYRINPPTRLLKGAGWAFGRSPMNWRPVDPPVKIGPAKRAALVTEANKRRW